VLDISKGYIYFCLLQQGKIAVDTMANVTTPQTALCIIPPENVWAQIQSIRSIHDKAYPRWMPHINLIYPFTPEANFDNIKAQLEPILKRKKPFQIQFDQTSLDYFKQKGEDCTYHLKPKNHNDVVELQKLIQNQLSNLIRNKRSFNAHLTLGQTTTSRISDILSEMKAKWTTIEFNVDRIYMISRENSSEDLFTIKNEILLLGEEDLSTEISDLTRNPVKPSAVNYLCVIPSQGFSSRLLRLFENTSFRPVKPFRINLTEYEDSPVDSDLRLKIESIPKFTLDFDHQAIYFDDKTSRVFLKPSDQEAIRRLNLLDDKYDGTLTLGEMHKNDFSEVSDRFTKSWTMGTNEFEVDRLHLMDTNGRFKFIFRLNTQSFS
jgi:2'-5' RNA ligase